LVLSTSCLFELGNQCVFEGIETVSWEMTLHGVAGQHRLVTAITLVSTGGEMVTLLNTQEIHLDASGAMAVASRSANNVPRLFLRKGGVGVLLGHGQTVSPNETSCFLVLRRIDDDEACAHESTSGTLPRARTLLVMIISGASLLYEKFVRQRRCPCADKK
jgi:hypothetical protein